MDNPICSLSSKVQVHLKKNISTFCSIVLEENRAGHERNEIMNFLYLYCDFQKLQKLKYYIKKPIFTSSVKAIICFILNITFINSRLYEIKFVIR